MSQTPLTTYHDILDFLLRVHSGTRDERAKLLAKSAILSAYQELPLLKRWKYYYRRGRIKTDAPYEEGTVSYDHSGGSSERLLTLTDGTWPTNAARGKVLIDNVEYSVASRIDDNNVTLSVNSNPGEDVASGTSYKWWRDVYTLPLDFRGADALVDHDDLWGAAHIAPGSVLNNRGNNQTSNQPRSMSFIADPDFSGAMAVLFNPPPSKVYHFDFMYTRSPLPLRVMEYSEGTVSVSSTTVTGSGTTWNDDMVGTVIRFPRTGTTDKIPTGLDGAYPYAEQRVVTAVSSTTSLTIDATLAGSFSGVKYRISDFIDVDYAVMMEAFRKMCEYRFAENLSRKDAAGRFRSWQQSIQFAREADGQRNFSNDVPAPVWYWNRLESGSSIADQE